LPNNGPGFSRPFSGWDWPMNC